MKAMILAAGLGQRMRPLTDNKPKPLLEINQKSLLDYHLEKIQQAGIRDVIINLAYLGEKIRHHIKQQPYTNLNILFSDEPEPLETGGAIWNADNLIGDETFLLVNGDVWCDIQYADFIKHKLLPTKLGHLLLVPNPDFHPYGDFTLDSQGELIKDTSSFPKFTFSGISLLSPSLIRDYSNKRMKFPLAEVFRDAISQNKLTGELHQGYWNDVGTPQRLHDLQEYVTSCSVESGKQAL